MTDQPSPDFDEPRLAAAVERLPPEAVEALPFGTIRLDAEGRVRVFSQAEEVRLSGFGTRQALGRAFFAEVAPCMDTEEFRGRIEQARAAGRLDLEFGWVGDFDERQREMRVRVQSASDGGCWIFLQREG